MEIKYKSKYDIEGEALRTLRNSKDKSLLSNKNIDCFVMGWEHAVSDIKEQIANGQSDDLKNNINNLIKFCSQKRDSLEMKLGYSGYNFSRPESAEEMFKLLNEMQRCCIYILDNIENVKLSHIEYYDKINENNKPY